MRAYCYASGLIEFGPRVPSGALPIARGPDKVLRAFIEGVARHGYSAREIDGRLTKIKGTECLLVSGVPEAPDEDAKLNALRAWLSWIATHRLPIGVSVFGGGV